MIGFLNLIISSNLSVNFPKEFCPTPCSKYTTYNNLYNNSNEGREEENKGQRGVYVVDKSKGVGQNKNNQLQDEKVVVITQAIKQLMEKNQKITIRKIQELSGVAKSTVEKHYKSILFDLSQDISEVNLSGISDNKVADITYNNSKLNQKKLKLEERFNKTVSGQMIVPDLINVLGTKTTNKIPIAKWSELINDVNHDSFERFWDNLQAYKSNYIR